MDERGEIRWRYQEKTYGLGPDYTGSPLAYSSGKIFFTSAYIKKWYEEGFVVDESFLKVSALDTQGNLLARKVLDTCILGFKQTQPQKILLTKNNELVVICTNETGFVI